MLKKEITFENLAGESVTREFYFHLSKNALIEMNFSKKGGLEKHLKEYIAEGDEGKILDTFKMIIFKAYGVPHEDGEQFIQSDALSDAFMQTDAYSELLVDLMSGATKAAEFVAAVVPASMRDGVLTADDSRQVLEGVEVETLSLPKPPVNPNPTVPTPEVSPLGIKNENDFGVSLEDILKAVSAGKVTLADAGNMSREELAKKIKNA